MGDRMNAAVEAAFQAVADVHKLMSFHEPESDLARLNHKARAEPVSVHPWTWQVLQTALDLHRLSGGIFDIAIAPVLQDMKLLPRHPDQPRPAASFRSASNAMELLHDGRVRFKHPHLQIDLGGIAKGFAVDRATDVLRQHGVPMGLVNAGGDLAAFGTPLWNIDIRNPREPACLLCRVGLRDAALASSGSCFDPVMSVNTRISAVIDPRIATAVRTPGATVRASSCMIADALTKVVMLAGPSAAPLLDHYAADAMIMRADGSLQMTQDFESAVCLAA
jgi:thiamine biosynthesis lipoprotein